MKPTTILVSSALAAVVAAQDLYPGLSNVNHTCVISMMSFSKLLNAEC